ncbi:MAG: DUF1573 domain-containing protein [Ginsengibacter sp.]|jgi:membrane peptidoglycan carboxypeptidase
MKNLLFAFLVLSSTVAFAQTKAPVAKFTSETFDFGKIKQNVPKEATFVFTNTTKQPLIIEQAAPSCGCTVSDYTKAPIAPGKTGTVKATYDAAAIGTINKSITVKFAGIDETTYLRLAGEVVPAK